MAAPITQFTELPSLYFERRQAFRDLLSGSETSFNFQFSNVTMPWSEKRTSTRQCQANANVQSSSSNNNNNNNNNDADANMTTEQSAQYPSIMAALDANADPIDLVLHYFKNFNATTSFNELRTPSAGLKKKYDNTLATYGPTFAEYLKKMKDTFASKKIGAFKLVKYDRQFLNSVYAFGRNNTIRVIFQTKECAKFWHAWDFVIRGTYLEKMRLGNNNDKLIESFSFQWFKPQAVRYLGDVLNAALKRQLVARYMVKPWNISYFVGTNKVEILEADADLLLHVSNGQGGINYVQLLKS